MKKFLMLFVLVFILQCNAAFCKNKVFWETKYTPTRIEYLSDKMFTLNEYLKLHVPPKTDYFFCSIGYNNELEEYRLICNLKSSSTYITQKTIQPFYSTIKSTVGLMFDRNSANISKSWSSNLPIVLSVDNSATNDFFIVDKNTYK